MATKLETLALQHIAELACDAQHVLVCNHENMGEFAVRDSGFGRLNEKLHEIERWIKALIDGA